MTSVYRLAVPALLVFGGPCVVSGMVDELCSFLAATGGKVIYGVNFKLDNVTASAAEAAYAQGKCGSSINGFEIATRSTFRGAGPPYKRSGSRLQTRSSPLRGLS